MNRIEFLQRIAALPLLGALPWLRTQESAQLNDSDFKPTGGPSSAETVRPHYNHSDMPGSTFIVPLHLTNEEFNAKRITVVIDNSGEGPWMTKTVEY